MRINGSGAAMIPSRGRHYDIGSVMLKDGTCLTPEVESRIRSELLPLDL